MIIGKGKGLIILGQASAIIIIGLFAGFILWGRSEKGRETLTRMGMIRPPKKRSTSVKKTKTTKVTTVKKNDGARKRTTVR